MEFSIISLYWYLNVLDLCFASIAMLTAYLVVIAVLENTSANVDMSMIGGLVKLA